MILLPAVDIRGGRAVRLRQGHFDQETVYADDPLDAARSFVEAGARYLHVVDLDGAREGEPANLDHLERIAGEAGVPVQYGGGLRSLLSIRKALAAGAERVVVGTAAYGDAEFLDEAIATWGPRVLVAVDVRGGHVSVSGWTRETQMRAKLRRSCRPSRDDFSGWNCTPIRCPRSTTDTNGVPYSPRPTMSSDWPGSQANECTW